MERAPKPKIQQRYTVPVAAHTGGGSHSTNWYFGKCCVPLLYIRSRDLNGS
jgi:hypothetical protein